MPRPERIDCVLFDCDGVLIDSEPIAARRNVVIFGELGIPATFEDCLTMCGQDGKTTIPAIGAKYGADVTADEFAAKKTECIERGLIDRVSYNNPEAAALPGIHDVLARLRAAGVRCGLVSTTVSSHILVCLDRFGLASCFDCIITGDMVERHKPDPMPYATAMEYLHVDPARTVVIEDSPAGIRSGLTAGCYVLGFTGSAYVKQDVSAANEVLPSYADFDLV